MMPHERSLLERLKDKPFAIVGVNADDDYGDDFVKKVEKNKVTWRSFRNSPGGDQPDIADTWNIEGFPTLYLIDAKGIIRYIWVGNPGDKVIDESIDKLIAETEKK